MYRLLTLVLVVAALVVPAAQAKPRPLAGPWYTPKELKALIAYSNGSHHGYSLTAKERAALDTYANASFANKQRILAGELPVAARSTASPHTLGGYSLTAKERAALDIYADASFSNKQRILASEPPVAARGFPWVATAAGSVTTLGALLVAAALLSHSVRARLRRPFVQTTVTGAR